MKNKIKLVTGIFLLTLTLYSCSSDSEETAVNALENELALENNGILAIESTTYIFKQTGETAKFLSENRDYNFKFVNDLSYTTTEDKHAIEGLTITNPETGEFMIFSNFEELKSGFFRFDVELSNGQLISSVKYKPGTASSSSNKWHGDPLIKEPSPVIGALIELSEAENVKQCRAALNSCSNTGGVPTIALTNGKGWFTAIEACSLVCHE
ncbi:hypothetical protein LZ575_06305 [Antarcticibacterium sp. 1MA-6-2]|uniref:hypothetical protein n=1 Tax=Antarcticibacterium sp. 1MA-6-2 TaxID=2908210 RepID=UPI001F26D7DF|nr:hypothetical protein [Antarcticibacterium sp. 1MA-6-2]UJH92184.1 hypothetical protein LZ575_06305 [Antarcticibacterium sp. 1MA-6-2]